MKQDILTLIKDYYSCWTGRDSNGRHCGLSSNPKAARRSEKLYMLFGDKWDGFSARVNDKLIELEEKWFDDNPKYEKYRSTGYGIGKAANETWPEAEKIIEAEFRKTFGSETIKSLNESTKVTLTMGQLKKLVRESSDNSMKYGLAGICNRLQILGNSMRALYELWTEATVSNDTKRAQACLREIKKEIDNLPKLAASLADKFNEVTKNVDFGKPALPDDANPFED